MQAICFRQLVIGRRTLHVSDVAIVCHLSEKKTNTATWVAYTAGGGWARGSSCAVDEALYSPCLGVSFFAYIVLLFYSFFARRYTLIGFLSIELIAARARFVSHVVADQESRRKPISRRRCRMRPQDGATCSCRTRVRVVDE